MSHLQFSIDYIEAIPDVLRFAPKLCNSSGTFDEPLAKSLIDEVGIGSWILSLDGQLNYRFCIDERLHITPQDCICLCNKAQAAIEALMDEADRMDRIHRAMLESMKERSPNAIS